jgi:hypothetical protein
MVPFSYFPGVLNSRVMNNYSSPVEVWLLGASDFSEAWVSAFGAFALSCLPAFLILTPVPVFRLYSMAKPGLKRF